MRSYGRILRGTGRYSARLQAFAVRHHPADLLMIVQIDRYLGSKPLAVPASRF